MGAKYEVIELDERDDGSDIQVRTPHQKEKCLHRTFTTLQLKSPDTQRQASQ